MTEAGYAQFVIGNRALLKASADLLLVPTAMRELVGEAYSCPAESDFR